ncbi:leucine-rich repeat protein (mitochondrion) [Artemisia annua]|uniref:Leucine-rich repeat protein n=1 Tax=Artemisia annua TaxID=35608 RepID=A0A2U1NJ44_ARTAN|nr:leucine-rich repeat protein [Artemisia annua]
MSSLIIDVEDHNFESQHIIKMNILAESTHPWPRKFLKKFFSPFAKEVLELEPVQTQRIPGLLGPGAYRPSFYYSTCSGIIPQAHAQPRMMHPPMGMRPGWKGNGFATPTRPAFQSSPLPFIPNSTRQYRTNRGRMKGRMQQPYVWHFQQPVQSSVESSSSQPTGFTPTATKNSRSQQSMLDNVGGEDQKIRKMEHTEPCRCGGSIAKTMTQVAAAASGIPTFLGSFTNLQSLVMSEANLTGPIPSQLGNLSGLVHLDLISNHLVGSIPFSLGELRSLTFLNLSFNQLEGVIPESFGNHSSLVQMYLSGNFLNGMFFLECLYLFNNSLNGSILDFMDCLSLATLYLANNQLSGNLPNTVGQLPNLVNVDVSHNSLDGSLSDFTGCQSQQHLNLSSNRLCGNSPNSSGQVSNLQHIDVSYNSLHGSIPDFTGCPSLTWLDLSSNRFSGNLPNSDILLILMFQTTPLKV